MRTTDDKSEKLNASKWNGKVNRMKEITEIQIKNQIVKLLYFQSN